MALKFLAIIVIAVAVVAIIAGVVFAVFAPSTSNINQSPNSEGGKSLSLDIKEGLSIQAKP